MVRRTISLPEAVDETVKACAERDEPYSRTVTRLIQAGARALKKGRRPEWIGSFSSGLPDLGLRAEHYLIEAIRRADRRR